jgi:hypothetical protein
MTYNQRQILLKLSHYEIERGGACGTHGAEDVYRISGGKEGHFEDLGIHCSIIL